MSESGFSHLPPGGRIFDPATVPVRTEQSVRIESVSAELQNLRTALRVEGKVAQIMEDGTAIIRTAQDDEIVVRLRGRVALSEGQNVEIDLPPGSPPRQALVRPAPEATPAPQHAPQTQAQTQAQTPPQTLPPPTAQSAPLPAEIRALLDEIAIPQAKPVAPVAPAPLLPGTIVRLTPLPAIPPAIQMLPLPVAQPATLPDPAFFKAVLAAPQMQSAALQTKAPDLLATPARDASLRPATLLLPGLAHPVTFSKPEEASARPAPVPPSPQAQTPLQTLMALMLPPAKIVMLPAMKPAALPDHHFLTQNARVPDVPHASVSPPRFDARIVATAPGASIKILAADGKASIAPAAQGPSPAFSPRTLSAEIVGTTLHGAHILSVFWPGAGEPLPFMMQTPAGTIPPGTQVQLLPLMQQAHHPAMQPASSGLPAPVFELMGGWTWPAFDEAAQILAQAAAHDPAAQVLNAILPRPVSPAQMTPALLFFIAAVQSGDMPGWMGDKAINALRREGLRGADALGRLTRDFSGLSKMQAEPLSQDWRGMAIPMLVQGEIQKIHLYYRHQGGEREEDGEESKERSTRFIFDLNLSRMGDVQLDGLMKGKRFDLILRTHTPFSHAMQATMRRTYLDVLEAGNLSGDLAFQTRKDQWIRVSIKDSGLKTSA